MIENKKININTSNMPIQKEQQQRQQRPTDSPNLPDRLYVRVGTMVMFIVRPEQRLRLFNRHMHHILRVDESSTLHYLHDGVVIDQATPFRDLLSSIANGSSSTEAIRLECFPQTAPLSLASSSSSAPTSNTWSDTCALASVVSSTVHAKTFHANSTLTTVAVDFDADNVADLKAKLSQVTNIPVCQQRLVFGHRELLVDTALVSSYGVTRNSTLFLVPRI
jgi:hypothetical protein